jgi:hypothetical protein
MLDHQLKLDQSKKELATDPTSKSEAIQHPIAQSLSQTSPVVSPNHRLYPANP